MQVIYYFLFSEFWSSKESEASSLVHIDSNSQVSIDKVKKSIHSYFIVNYTEIQYNLFFCSCYQYEKLWNSHLFPSFNFVKEPFVFAYHW